MIADMHCGNCGVYHGNPKRIAPLCAICEDSDMWEPREDQDDGGLKDDKGKLDLSLIPPEVFELLGQVYAYGAEKYIKNSWAMGISEDRLLAAALRHYVSYIQGEVYDKESGLSHLSCAAWSFLTVEIYRLRRGNGNDRQD